MKFNPPTVKKAICKLHGEMYGYCLECIRLGTSDAAESVPSTPFPTKCQYRYKSGQRCERGTEHPVHSYPMHHNFEAVATPVETASPEYFEVVDYATGVAGTYCVGRKEGAFMSFWNPTGWAGSGYVFTDKRLAEAVMKLESQLTQVRSEFRKLNGDFQSWLKRYESGELDSKKLTQVREELAQMKGNSQ